MLETIELQSYKPVYAKACGMWKYIVAAILLLSLGSTYYVVSFGLRPRSIPIIRPSNFENPDKLAEYIYRQMFEVINESPVLVMGIDQKSEYQKEVVRYLTEKIGPRKKIITIDAFEAYHAVPNTQIHILESNEKQKIPSFIFEELVGVREIPELQDCSKDIRFQVWIECNKENKLRMMRISKKAKQDQIIAVFDRISERDWVSYIKF